MAIDYSKLTDRTAVLALGLVAGFAVGLSFNDGGRARVSGWVAPGGGDAAPQPAVAAALPPDRSTPELGQAVPLAVVARVRASGRIRVGVFGDSFGNGVWGALYRQLPATQGFDVLQFSKEATGFTRYNRLDLTARAHEQLAAQPVDIAVICFGANDLQPLWKGIDIYPLLGTQWKAIVGPRIDAFVAAARSTGATVYWLGLPIVRDPTMDAQLRAMEAFYAEHLRRLGVPLLDTRAASVDASGHYNAHLPDAKGHELLVREPDGLHMNGIGYDRVTAALAGRIRAQAARLRRQAGLPPVVAPTVAAAS